MTQHRTPESLLSPRWAVVNVGWRLGNISLPDKIIGMLEGHSMSLKLIDREGRATKMLQQLNHTLGRKVLLFSCGLMTMVMASSCIPESLGEK